MHTIATFDAFKLYQPSAEGLEAHRARIEYGRRRNAAYLRRHVPPETPPGRITGSFICAHAPDYVGAPALDWDEAGWRRLFADMAAAGLDTVIWQASAWRELREVYYPSKALASYRGWNVVEPMLAAARAEGMTVFLGGYGSVVGWTAELSARAIADERARQWRCMEELLRWRELFAGVYFSPETAFAGERDVARETSLNRLYRDYFNRLKDAEPTLRLLMSPASKYHPGRGEMFGESWRALLDGVALDILAPQDSIGCGGCSLEEQPAMWRRWRRVAMEMGLRLWANVELFERRCFGGKEPFVTAAPERVLSQLAHVGPQVEKCVCWEYPYFVREARGADALRRALFAPEYSRTP